MMVSKHTPAMNPFATGKAHWGDDSDDETPAEQPVVAGPIAAIRRYIEEVKAEHARSSQEFKADEKKLVSGLHDLSMQTQKNVLEMRACLVDLLAVVSAIDVQKGAILESWRKFVSDIGETSAEWMALSAPKVSAPVASAPPVVPRSSYAAAARPIGRASTGETDLSITRVQIGLADIQAQTVVAAADVPTNAIRYMPSIGSFVINWNGQTYSFGGGTFVSRRGRDADETLYGKRCNTADGACTDRCTYYHDPLKYANGHTTRNMAIHYIFEELIKGVASDVEIQATVQDKNPFIVQDLVQLAGMLLVKASAITSLQSGPITAPVRRRRERGGRPRERATSS